MTEYDHDDLDYELEDDEEDFGRFISDDLEILSDYYDLMEDEGLTKAEFKKYKTQCIRRLKAKKYISASDMNVKALKFAHNLHKVGCLTKEEYEMVKHRIEQLLQREEQSTALFDKNYNLHYMSSKENRETRGTKLFVELKDLFKSKKKGKIDEERYLSEKERIIEKIVNSDDTSQEYAYKYAGELYQIGAITSDEYEKIIQDSMDDRLKNAPIDVGGKWIRVLRNLAEREKEEYEDECRESWTNVWESLWELIKLTLYILSIPFRIVFWILEICLVGYENVWKRDEFERIMRERDDDK